MSQPKLIVALRITVDECLEAESLDEPLQLSLGDGPFHEIDEVRANPALRKEALGFARVSALLDAEDLYFHRSKVERE